MTQTPRSQRASSHALSVVSLSVVVLALATACATPYPAPSPQAQLTLNVWQITAPVSGTGKLELQRMGPQRSFAPAKLRRAHIYTETGQTRRALGILNVMLSSHARPTPAVESYALYMRARTYDKQGNRQRGIEDCRRAHKIAMDVGLRRATKLFLQKHQALAEHKKPQVGSGVKILGRSGWGAAAAQPGNMARMSRIYRITIHHTANPIRTTDRQECAHAIRMDQRYHMGRKGWGDIGYHFLVDPAGRVWEGRRLRWQGAHAGNNKLNRGNIGICLMGNFVNGRRGQHPTPAQVTALAAMLAKLCRAHGIDSRRIYTHQEMPGAATACPGRRLQTVVERLRRSSAVASAAGRAGSAAPAVSAVAGSKQ